MAKINSVSEPTPFLSYVPSVLPPVFLEHHGKALFRAMKEWEAKKRFPPVLLLTGQSGIGKRSAAYFLGQWILCESRTPSHPCGTCSSCRKVIGGHSVDLIEIQSRSSEDAPEEKSDHHTEGTLKIDSFRKLRASAGFTAFEGSFKVILIPNADRMTPQAANSVLKLLEEPPAGWVFLLTTNDPTLLLPTLVSRCQILRLRPFPIETLKELLTFSGVDSKRISVCAEHSHGSWRRALEFASDLVWEKRAGLLQIIKTSSSALAPALTPLLDWATQEPSHFETLLDLMEQITADLIRQSCKAESPNRETLKGRSFWLERAEDIASIRKEADAPVNRKLLTQRLLLPWLGAGLRTGSMQK